MPNFTYKAFSFFYLFFWSHFCNLLKIQAKLLDPKLKTEWAKNIFHLP